MNTKVFVLLFALISSLSYAAETSPIDPLDRVWDDIIQEQQQEECVKGVGPLLLSSEVEQCAKTYQFERQEEQAQPEFEERWVIP